MVYTPDSPPQEGQRKPNLFKQDRIRQMFMVGLENGAKIRQLAEAPDGYASGIQIQINMNQFDAAFRGANRADFEKRLRSALGQGAGADQLVSAYLSEFDLMKQGADQQETRPVHAFIDLSGDPPRARSMDVFPYSSPEFSLLESDLRRLQKEGGRVAGSQSKDGLGYTAEEIAERVNRALGAVQGGANIDEAIDIVPRGKVHDSDAFGIYQRVRQIIAERGTRNAA